MTIEIPQYGLKAYALLYAKHGMSENFKQSELDWIVSGSMKFSLKPCLAYNKAYAFNPY